MKIFKNLITYLSLLIFIDLFFGSCSKKSNLIDEDNNIYIESFEYEVVENDSSVDKELAYSLSFDIRFSFEENVKPEEIIVKIEGKKTFQFTMDYCNTENITLSLSTDTYPFALLNYTVPQDVNSMEANVKIKITTTDLMDDINNFLTINCDSDDFNFIDNNNFTLYGYFKMNYSSDTGIYYEYNEFSESYKIVSVITKSKTLEIPSIYNNHPVKEIDKNAFTSVTQVEELILPNTLTSIPEGLLSGMTKLKSLTIPFLGASLNEKEKIYFGYIFGASSYEDNSSYVPNSLREVNILGGTSIGDYAFRECSSLTSITMPKNITSIGSYAFSSCSSLKGITIPSSVTSIGEKAFENCSGLTSIIIPDSLKNIGLQTFSGCSNIEQAIIPAIALPSISRDMLRELIITSGTSIKNNRYSSWPSLESIIIPETITSIESGTFSSCENLIKATMPTTAISYIPKSKLQEVVIIGGENISKEAFQNCKNLSSVVIGESVTNIEDNAFTFCYNLTSLTIGKNVKTIDSSAFYKCFKLVEVYNLSNLAITKGSSDNGYVGYYAKAIHTQEESNLIEKDGYVFVKDEEGKYYLVKYNGTETDLILTDNIEGCNYAINQYAFYKCNSLTSVKIPNSVISIGDRVFEDCSGLTSITIPFIGSSLNATSNAHFQYIFGVTVPSSLKEVILTGGTRIGERAFYACENITSITMPESITSIEAYAFSGCSKLTSIIIPNSVTKIDPYAFSGCSYNLKYNEYENGLYLGSKLNPYLCLVKARDTAISSCKISESTKFIHSSAFFGCDSLTSITIPDSVISIGEGAFSDCNNLKTVSIPAFALSYFPKNKLQEIIITSGTTIESNAFAYCNNVIRIEIPESITYIKKDIFSDCNKLEYNEYENGLYLGNSSNPYICLVKVKDISITTFTINESTKFIYASAFDYCSNLEYNEYENGLYLGNSNNPYLCLIKVNNKAMTTFTINESTKFIYTSAFEYYSSLTSITIPDSVISIGDYAFSNCYSLTSITIPDSVISIGEYAFNSCSSLTSIVIPDSVMIIEKLSFYKCSNLTSVIIGNGITYIGPNTFSGCNNLKEVYYNGTIEDWNKLNIDSDNNYLVTAEIYYYSFSKPTEEGNYWHYVDGVVTKW